MQIKPDFYFADGGVPVFRPSYADFKDFATFVRNVEPYGLVASIVFDFKQRLSKPEHTV